MMEIFIHFEMLLQLWSMPVLVIVVNGQLDRWHEDSRTWPSNILLISMDPSCSHHDWSIHSLIDVDPHEYITKLMSSFFRGTSIAYSMIMFQELGRPPWGHLERSTIDSSDRGAIKSISERSSRLNAYIFTRCFPTFDSPFLTYILAFFAVIDNQKFGTNGIPHF